MEVTLDTPTNFINFMGNNPLNRTLDFLIENKRTSWAMTEIRDMGRVSYPSLKIIIPKLMRIGLVKVGRKVGRIKFYTLDFNNPVVKNLERLWEAINIYEMEKFIEEEKLKKSH